MFFFSSFTVAQREFHRSTTEPNFQGVKRKQSERQGRFPNIEKNAMYTEDRNSYARIKDTYSTSCCASMVARGGLTELRGVTVNSDFEQHREARGCASGLYRHDRQQIQGSRNSLTRSLFQPLSKQTACTSSCTLAVTCRILGAIRNWTMELAQSFMTQTTPQIFVRHRADADSRRKGFCPIRATSRCQSSDASPQS